MKEQSREVYTPKSQYEICCLFPILKYDISVLITNPTYSPWTTKPLWSDPLILLFLGDLAKIWLLGAITIGVPVICWSLGHSITRSLGHSVTQSLGHSVTWSLGHSVIRSLYHLVTRPYRRLGAIRRSASNSPTPLFWNFR